MTEQPPEAPSSTGDSRVDSVVERLAAVDALSLPEQVEAFAEMHADLAAVLDGESEPATADDA